MWKHHVKENLKMKWCTLQQKKVKFIEFLKFYLNINKVFINPYEKYI
jgi:hypothetical protein